VKGLVDGSLGVEREGGIDLSGDFAGDDLEDLLAELDEEVVEGGIDLLVGGAGTLLGLGDSGIQKGSILRLLSRGQDQGRVGGGILGLVLGDRCGKGVSLEKLRQVGVARDRLNSQAKSPI